MERICVYPGSFDPITIGHMDVIRRACALFDRVIVAVLHNPAKRGCFPVEERMGLIAKACGELPQVTVDSFDGLLADYMRRTGAACVVRGLRAVSDFETEQTM
ncbi:MAG: pantetheine-phosphate adenylyltransferase, partial [Aristaeellaceae bacterium]